MEEREKSLSFLYSSSSFPSLHVHIIPQFCATIRMSEVDKKNANTFEGKRKTKTKNIFLVCLLHAHSTNITDRFIYLR